MAPQPEDIARQVLIAYRQLESIVKSDIGAVTARTQLQSYNRILETLKQCFSIDKVFSDSVNHLQPLGPSLDDLPWQMESDGRVLLATAHSFIELYLSP